MKNIVFSLFFLPLHLNAFLHAPAVFSALDTGQPLPPAVVEKNAEKTVLDTSASTSKILPILLGGVALALVAGGGSSSSTSSTSNSTSATTNVSGNVSSLQEIYNRHVTPQGISSAIVLRDRTQSGIGAFYNKYNADDAVRNRIQNAMILFEDEHDFMLVDSPNSSIATSTLFTKDMVQKIVPTAPLVNEEHSIHSEMVLYAMAGAKDSSILDALEDERFGPLAGLKSTAYYASYENFYSSMRENDITSAVVLNNSWECLNCNLHASLNRIANSSSLNGWNYFQLPNTQAETQNQLTNMVADDDDLNSPGLDGSYNSQLEAVYPYFKTSTQAFKDFTQHGVLVYALQNDYVSYYTQKPKENWYKNYLPSILGYQDSVLYVSNFNINDNELIGSNLNQGIYNAQTCYRYQERCLVADGTALPLWSYNISDEEYKLKVGYGTSFAAPAVSSMVYMMAAVFPNNTPKQWAQRLLMTARLESIPNYQETISHQKNFTTIEGEVLEKDVSFIYGMGIPDLQKAVNPIGPLNLVANGELALTHLNESDLLPLSETLINGKHSSSLLHALKDLDESIYAYDLMGFSFPISFKELLNIKDKNANLRDRSIKTIGGGEGLSLSVVSSVLSNGDLDTGFSLLYQKKNYSAVVALNAQMSFLDFQFQNRINDSAFNFYQPSFLFSDFSNSNAFSFKTPLNSNDSIGFGWLSGNEDDSGTDSYVVNFSSSFNKKMDYSIFLGQQDARNFAWGSVLSGAMKLEDNVHHRYMGAVLNMDVNDWLFSGFFQGGAAEDANGVGLINAISNAKSLQWGVSFSEKTPVRSGRWSLGIHKPQHLTQGSVNLRLNTGFEEGKFLTFTQRSLNLESSHQQINYFLHYQQRIDDLNLQFRADYIQNEFNQANQSDWQFSVLLSDF